MEDEGEGEGHGWSSGSDFATDIIFGEGDTEGGDDSVEGGSHEKAQPNRDSIIFLIDSSPAMFVTNSAGEVPFDLSVRAALETLKSKIISSENDLVSVIFYATVSHKQWPPQGLAHKLYAE